MEKEYDFSKTQQGKFFRPIEELEIPVYLDKEGKEKTMTDVMNYLETISSETEV